MEDRLLLVVLIVIAAVVCVPLAFLTEGLFLHHGLLTPGMHVWAFFHPRPEPGFRLGSLLGTTVVVDSICWFIVLIAAASLVHRVVKKRTRVDNGNDAQQTPTSDR